MVTLLRDYGYISTNRLREIVASITNNKIVMSNVSIINYSNTLGQEIAKVLEILKEKLIAESVMNCDETSVRINGEMYGVHNYSNTKTTYYQLHKTRGEQAIIDAGILTDYEGVLVSDHFSMYFKYGTDRAECNVHLLRYLYAIEENQKRKWAVKRKDLLLRVKKEKIEILLNDGTCFSQSRIEEEYDLIIKGALEEYNRDPSKIKAPSDEDMKLYRRLVKNKHEQLLFAYDFHVPFSNNLSERDLRMFKSKLKVFGSFRSAKAAENYINTCSLISTLKKNKKNVASTIMEIFDIGIEKAIGINQLLID